MLGACGSTLPVETGQRWSCKKHQLETEVNLFKQGCKSNREMRPKKRPNMDLEMPHGLGDRTQCKGN